MTTSAKSPLSSLADDVLGGEALSRDRARALLGIRDEQLRDLLWAAFRCLEATFGRRVKLCVLQNARSGLCPEDCHYCSQSSVSTAEIPRYRLLSEEALVDGARNAGGSGAARSCMGTRRRGPSQPDIERLTQAASRIKREFPEIEICVSLGLTSEAQARAPKASVVAGGN